MLSPYPTNIADHILAPAGANSLSLRDSRDYFVSVVNQKAASWFAVTSVGNGFTESRKQRRTEWTNMIRIVYILYLWSVSTDIQFLTEKSSWQCHWFLIEKKDRTNEGITISIHLKLPFLFKWTRDQQSIHFQVISHIIKAKKSADKRTCISSAACAMLPVVMWKPAWLWHLWRSPDWNVKAVFTIKESSNLGTAHYLWGWPGQTKSDRVMRNFVPETTGYEQNDWVLKKKLLYW